MITLIIPAHNEQGYIGDCLKLILASRGFETRSTPVQVIVVANGCSDATVAEASLLLSDFVEKGWQLDVLNLKQGGKVNALNAGDRVALYHTRIYIDADIHVSDNLILELSQALNQTAPVYASGRPNIRPAKSFVSSRYACFWEKLPFMARGVPGCGVYAVNTAARMRWSKFPEIIADDTFVRHHFTPEEMHGVPATYSWPITEGFGNLVRVRRRQDIGLKEVRRLYPHLTSKMKRTSPNWQEKLSLLLRDPLGFVIYSAVALAVYLPIYHNHSAWDRGR